MNGLLTPAPARGQKPFRRPAPYHPRPLPGWLQAVVLVFFIQNVTNTYDGDNRLHVEAITGSAPNVTTTYDYDAANNRTDKIVSGAGTITYSYNNLNQLTGYGGTGVSVGFTYDNNGNRATRVISGQTDNTS